MGGGGGGGVGWEYISPSSELPFPSLLLPLRVSFHVNFSTPFTPPHSQIPLLNAAGVSFVIFFFSCWKNTSYLPVQKVTTVYSIDIIFTFDFNSSDARLPLFPSLRPSVLDTHLKYAGGVLVVAAEPLFVYLFVTWHLTS